MTESKSEKAKIDQMKENLSDARARHAALVEKKEGYDADVKRLRDEMSSSMAGSGVSASSGSAQKISEAQEMAGVTAQAISKIEAEIMSIEHGISAENARLLQGEADVARAAYISDLEDAYRAVLALVDARKRAYHSGVAYYRACGRAGRTWDAGMNPPTLQKVLANSLRPLLEAVAFPASIVRDMGDDVPATKDVNLVL